MRRPSHRKNNPNWPRKHGRPREQKRLPSPAWMTPEVMALMRKIQASYRLLGGDDANLQREVDEAIERDLDAQIRHRKSED